MKCSNCGVEIREGTAFCPKCGTRQSGQSLSVNKPVKKGLPTDAIIGIGAAALAVVAVIVAAVIFLRGGSGELVEIIFYDGFGNIDYRIEYKYDSQGNQTEIISYNCKRDESISGRAEYKYDGQGNQIEWTIYEDIAEIGVITTRYEYKYNSHGNLTKETYYGAGGSSMGYKRYFYK